MGLEATLVRQSPYDFDIALAHAIVPSMEARFLEYPEQYLGDPTTLTPKRIIRYLYEETTPDSPQQTPSNLLNSDEFRGDLRSIAKKIIDPYQRYSTFELIEFLNTKNASADVIRAAVNYYYGFDTINTAIYDVERKLAFKLKFSDCPEITLPPMYTLPGRFETVDRLPAPRSDRPERKKGITRIVNRSYDIANQERTQTAIYLGLSAIALKAAHSGLPHPHELVVQDLANGDEYVMTDFHLRHLIHGLFYTALAHQLDTPGAGDELSVADIPVAMRLPYFEPITAEVAREQARNAFEKFAKDAKWHSWNRVKKGVVTRAINNWKKAKDTKTEGPPCGDHPDTTMTWSRKDGRYVCSHCKN